MAYVPSPNVPPLPAVETPLAAEAVVGALRTASRRGRLAGFEEGRRGELFRAAAFGKFFDLILIGEVEPARGGTRIRFRLVLPALMPSILTIVLVGTVWPGLPITESLMHTYLPSIAEWTIWWYLPLTALPLPWILRKVFKDSIEAGRASAGEVIEKIRAEVGGGLIEGGSGAGDLRV